MSGQGKEVFEAARYKRNDELKRLLEGGAGGGTEPGLEEGFPKWLHWTLRQHGVDPAFYADFITQCLQEQVSQASMNASMNASSANDDMTLVHAGQLAQLLQEILPDLAPPVLETIAYDAVLRFDQ